MASEMELLNALHTLKNHCMVMKGNCPSCLLRNSKCTCGVFSSNGMEYNEFLTDLVLKNNELPRLILG